MNMSKSMRHTLVTGALLLASCGPGSKSMPNTTTPAEPPVTTTTPAGEPVKPAEPPVAKLWIAEKCDAHLGTARKLRDGFAVKPATAPDALGTLGAFNDVMIELDNAAAMASLYSSVHPQVAMREAADGCMQEISALGTEISLDRAIYDRLAAVDTKGLDATAKRYLSMTLRDFRRAGVDKDEATRKRIKEIEERAVIVGQTFDKNIRDDVRSIKVKPEQLAGLPQDWKDEHKPGTDGLVTITTDYPDYVPFRTYASDAPARAELYKVYMNRGWPANDAVFKELLALRRELAKLVGYENWPDYSSDVKMIKNGKAIGVFIDKIAKASAKAAKRDYAALLARKRKDDPKATGVEGADAVYYETVIKKERFAFDPVEVRKYFDFQRTLEGLLTVNSKLFGVTFVKAEGVTTWHADVQVFDVYYAGAKDKLGRIYLDLHPREGKYKHAAQFTMVSGVEGRQLPEGALVCNFNSGLIEHDDVETMFHEFGHLMHHILAGKQKWVRFSGVATEHDFVEAPSQLLEEWAWDHSVLSLFAKDKDGNVIPADLVKRMRGAKEFGKGVWVRTQMFYAAMSLGYYMADPATLDGTKLLTDMQKKYSMIPYTPDTHMQASFGHLNGYSSGYYTYMWSLVIAKDLFSSFEKNGLMDEKTGFKYRDAVMVPGGSKDAADLVKDFLGRPYAFDSYKRWLDKQ